MFLLSALQRVSPLPCSYGGIAPIVTRPVAVSFGLDQIRKAWNRATSELRTIGRSYLQGTILPEKKAQEPEPLRDLLDWAPSDWTEREFRFLTEALFLPLNTENLVEDFYQTTEGNCAMVATLKAGIRKFGGRLFRRVQRDSADEWSVELRDGSQVRLTLNELAMAKGAAKLEGAASPTKSLAVFAYGVGAKRLAELTPAMDLSKGFTGGWLSEAERLERALNTLASGHTCNACANYLGVGNELRFRNHTSGEKLKDESTVVSSGSHATYIHRMGQENKADHYGRSVDYDGTDTNGRPILRRYSFEGPGLQEIDGWFYT